jgi:hypothetical protein
MIDATQSWFMSQGDILIHVSLTFLLLIKLIYRSFFNTDFLDDMANTDQKQLDDCKEYFDKVDIDIDYLCLFIHFSCSIILYIEQKYDSRFHDEQTQRPVVKILGVLVTPIYSAGIFKLQY